MNDWDYEEASEDRPGIRETPGDSIPQSEPADRRIAVGQIFSGTLRAMLEKKGSFAKAIPLPALAVAAITVEGDFSEFDALRAMIGLLVGPPLMTVIAVSCHRLVLLDPDSLPSPWGFFWTRRETRFLGWSIRFLVGWIVVLVSVSAVWGMLGNPSSMDLLRDLQRVGNLRVWVVLGPFLLMNMYFTARLGLVLPARAIDQNLSAREAWALSRGNGWRLATVLFLPPALFLPVNALASSSLPGLVPQIGLTFLEVLSVVVGIAFFSSAYSSLSRRRRTMSPGGSLPRHQTR